MDLEIIEIDIALRITLHHDHLHARHGCGGGVGAVRRRRYETHRALGFIAAAMVCTDGEQSGIFALRTRIGLQGNRVVTRDVAQRAFERREQILVPLPLLGRRKRVQAGESGPRHRNHLSRCIELHRAGAQGNHGAIEGQIAIAQAADVPKHLGLGPVAVKYRVREERRGAPQCSRNTFGKSGMQSRGAVRRRCAAAEAA